MSDDTFIIRNPDRDRFTTIDNRTLQDPELSWAETGMLAYLLSLPDNWRVNVRDLWRRKSGTGTGREAVRKTMARLEERGYLVRRPFHNDAGEFAGTVIEVHETPAAACGQTVAQKLGHGADVVDIHRGKAQKLGSGLSGTTKEPPLQTSVSTTADSKGSRARERDKSRNRDGVKAAREAMS